MLIATLTLTVVAFLLLVTKRTLNVGYQLDDMKMLYIAEAGVERAVRAIRDDVTSTTQTGTADMRGSGTSGSVSISNPDQMRYIDGSTATINNNSDDARLSSFDLNYPNTRITSVLLGVRASRASGGTGATIQVSYTTNGSFPQAGNTALTQALTTTLTTYTASITSDRTWTWPTINSSNFIMRAVRTAGNRDINIDAMFLRVTYEIDTNTEAWYTGSYVTLPINLNGGTVDSITIADEAGKVHLNTASQSLLRYLMVRLGTADATANTVATNIVTYRSTNNFDSVEEVQLVTGMTSDIYNAIKDYVTVYSYINSSAARPTGNRAPININTAPVQVLGAVFDALSLGSGDATSLANDIVTQRAIAPFTCFYSSDSSVTTDFYDFARGRSYLSTAGDPDEQDMVLDNADASSLVPVSGSTGFNAVTTEFCYDTSAFKVTSVASLKSRAFRIQEMIADTGSRQFTTFAGDTTSVGWRKENFQ